MLDQLPAEVVRFQVVLRVERMNDPHLIAGAASRDVETLFEEFLVAQGERTTFGRVHQGDEHHVAFVSLELRGVPAEYAMEFVAVGRDVGTDQVVDFDGLLVANQRNHSDAQCLARVILPVFGLLQRGRRWTRLASRNGLMRPSYEIILLNWMISGTHRKCSTRQVVPPNDWRARS